MHVYFLYSTSWTIAKTTGYWVGGGGWVNFRAQFQGTGQSVDVNVSSGANTHFSIPSPKTMALIALGESQAQLIHCFFTEPPWIRLTDLRKR